MICKEHGGEFDPSKGHVSIDPNLCLDCWTKIWDNLKSEINY